LKRNAREEEERGEEEEGEVSSSSSGEVSEAKQKQTSVSPPAKEQFEFSNSKRFLPSFFCYSV
jgi:hypothetical protein